MKLRNLFLGILLCATTASAQDVITKTDGSKIDAKVEQITDAVINYRKASNPTGPIYTVPIASVATIVYENGSVDKFNATAPAAAASTSLSDDALLRYAEANNITSASNSTYMNDAQLMRLTADYLPDELRKKAKKYQIIGWAGGAAFLVSGIAISSAIWGGDSNYYNDQFWGVMAAGAAVGAGWCLGFNLKARSLMKRAEELELHSSTIIEDNILSFGDKSLMAGVNVMNNHMTRTQGVGLSLKLNF